MGSRILALSIATLVALTGCIRLGAGTTRVGAGGITAEKMKNGTLHFDDTPALWDEFRRMMDMHIELERAGKPAGGRVSWSDFWNLRIRALAPERQEHSAKYINYIIEARRKAGLPELDIAAAER